MSTKNLLYRLIDANRNRLSEALRVLEDIVRFIQNDAKLTQKIKKLRHQVRLLIKKIPIREDELIKSRDVEADVGQFSFSPAEAHRASVGEVARANFHRAAESLRVLEEILKLFDPQVAFEFKKLRYQVYQIETETKDSFQ